MTVTVNLPVVGGSQDTWGQLLNESLQNIADGVNGANGAKMSPDLDSLIIDGDTVTATADELSKLAGFIGTVVALNNAHTFLDGAQSGVEVGGKAVIYGAQGSVALGNGWVVESNGNDLDFKIGGSRRMKLYSNGDLAVEGNVTAYASL